MTFGTTTPGSVVEVEVVVGAVVVVVVEVVVVVDVVVGWPRTSALWLGVEEPPHEARPHAARRATIPHAASRPLALMRPSWPLTPHRGPTRARRWRVTSRC